MRYHQWTTLELRVVREHVRTEEHPHGADSLKRLAIKMGLRVTQVRPRVTQEMSRLKKLRMTRTGSGE